MTHRTDRSKLMRSPSRKKMSVHSQKDKYVRRSKSAYCKGGARDSKEMQRRSIHSLVPPTPNPPPTQQKPTKKTQQTTPTKSPPKKKNPKKKKKKKKQTQGKR